jgi:2-keto-4-pentenoate hydratase/2-oxohepta-3-ene-1,7-dioic acid hydratase in catechol pathway
MLVFPKESDQNIFVSAQENNEINERPMRFARFLDKTNPHPALVDKSGNYRSLKTFIPDIHVAHLSMLSSLLENVAIEKLPLVDPSLPFLPCLGGIGKVVCIGKNYPEHAKELGGESPKEPILFLKATSAISGPFDPILVPRGSEKLDWEVELGVVISKPGAYIIEAFAMDHVFGYCTADDVSERAFQTERGGQWTKGKSADSFCPLGPWLATKDEIPDPQNLNLWLEVNGEQMQNGNTRDMTFKISHLIHYISYFMSLQAGDIILTGTPSGVGKGMNPPRFLKPGDVVRLGVEGLGEQEHAVKRA